MFGIHQSALDPVTKAIIMFDGIAVQQLSQYGLDLVVDVVQALVIFAILFLDRIGAMKGGK